MMYRHQHLCTDFHIRINQRIKRLDNSASRRVLYRNHTKVAMAFADLIENTPDIRQRFILDTLPELKHRRCMTKAAAWPKIANP